MKQQRHPNYYQMLLLAGATVLRPVEMKPGAEKGKGRVWTVSAKLMLDGYEIAMDALFHGALTETTETGQANLNIKRVVVRASEGRLEYPRSSFKALMLVDGVYVCPKHTLEVCAEMSKLANYNSALYVGIPEKEEMARIEALGYRRIIAW
jgi:hypothetical protein